MRGFALRVLVFLVPLALAAAPFEIILWRSGECWPARRAADAMSKDGRALYMRRYFSQQFTLYKAEMIRRRSPDLVILGSSRVWQFRSFMFHPIEERAFNAGGLTQSVRDLESYADWVLRGKIPRPRVVILGVDPWWVKRAEGDTPVDRNREWDEGYRPVAHFDGIRNMILGGRIPWSLVLHRPKSISENFHPLGLAAVQDGVGFRNDGSYFCGEAILEESGTTRAFRDRLGVAGHILAMTSQFTPSPGIDWSRVDRLVESLRRLRAAGIEIHLFLPTFSEEAATAFRTSPGLGTWWNEYVESFPAFMAKAGFPCLKALTPSTYGLDDTCMIDGYHPGELLVSYIVEDLIRRAPAGSLLSKLDIGHLKYLRTREGAMPLALRGGE
ncbi:MAG TPA: hypothetical protein VK661_01595 [Planctomycetota bacterium]|nr:hypothetical protein [Planctomycetota bacterium]